MQGHFIHVCKSMGAVAPIDWKYPREGGYFRSVREVLVMGAVAPIDLNISYIFLRGGLNGEDTFD